MIPENMNEGSEGGLQSASCCASSRRGLSGGGMLALLAMSGMIGMGLPRMRGSRSARAERNDPDREKTPADLERLAAAQRKRERKAALRSRHNAKAMASADTQTPKENGTL